MKENYRKNVCAIVINEFDEILILRKKKYNEWQFFQGSIESGESDYDTLRREIKEEIGVNDFKIIGESKHVNQYDWPEDLQKEREFKGQIQNFFLVNIFKENKILLEDEFSEYKLVKIEDVPKIVSRKDILESLNYVRKEFPDLLK
jgi:putative (di)nucleoside polyphosphate hydrolase